MKTDMNKFLSSHYPCPHCKRYTYEDIWLCVWCRQPIHGQKKSRQVASDLVAAQAKNYRPAKRKKPIKTLP